MDTRTKSSVKLKAETPCYHLYQKARVIVPLDSRTVPCRNHWPSCKLILMMTWWCPKMTCWMLMSLLAGKINKSWRRWLVDMKSCSVGRGLVTIGLGIVSLFGPGFYVASPALDCRDLKHLFRTLYNYNTKKLHTQLNTYYVFFNLF